MTVWFWRRPPEVCQRALVYGRMPSRMKNEGYQLSGPRTVFFFGGGGLWGGCFDQCLKKKKKKKEKKRKKKKKDARRARFHGFCIKKERRGKQKKNKKFLSAGESCCVIARQAFTSFRRIGAFPPVYPSMALAIVGRRADHL